LWRPNREEGGDTSVSAWLRTCAPGEAIGVIKTVTEAVVDGYGPGEVALIPRLTEGEPQMRQAFEANVIEPLLAVVLSDGETAVLKIEGHSDREDSPGLSREQRRQSELAASVARANSATDGAFELLAFEFPGLFPASDRAQVGVMPTGAGGAQLVESADSLTEVQRRRNRRVSFILIRFQPSF
jgi:hypothetical protein